MNRIETTLGNVREDIANFYREDKHHFITMNAVEVGDKMEYQWFFCDYAWPSADTMFVAQDSKDALVPTLKEVIPSWAVEAELKDLMGINVEDAKSGFVLEPDMEWAPQRKKK